MCRRNRHGCYGGFARGRGEFGPRRGCRRNKFGAGPGPNNYGPGPYGLGYHGEPNFTPISGQAPVERRPGFIGMLADAFGLKKPEKAQPQYGELPREVVVQRQDQSQVKFEDEKAGYDNFGFKEQGADAAPPRYSFVGR